MTGLITATERRSRCRRFLLASIISLRASSCFTHAFPTQHVHVPASCRRSPSFDPLVFVRTKRQTLFAKNDNPEESSPYGRNRIRHTPHELSRNTTLAVERQEEETLAITDPMILKRDRALLALHSTLNMDIRDAMTLLNNFPQLYTDVPSLATRILYLHQELNLPKKKIAKLLQKHPSMMARVLLNDPEQNLSSTVELLQTELNLTAEEILAKKLWQLDRMELRPKLYLFKTNLRMTRDDIVEMIQRNPLLLNQDLTRVEKQMEYLIHGPVGQGLGSITRRGVSVQSATTPQEEEDIILQRVRSLYIKYPDVVATPGLKGTVDFLMKSFGCTVEQLGKIVYRRPQLLQYDVGTLQEKAQYFANTLGLPLKFPAKSKSVMDLMALMPDVFTQSILSNLEPKFRFFLENLNMSQTELQKIVVDRPQILSLSLESNLKPKIEYLRQARVSDDDIRELFVAFPQGLRESLADRIRPRCQVILDKGLSIPNDVPLNFLVMTENQWRVWVEADFDESRIDDAKERLGVKKPRKKRSRQKRDT